MRANAVAHRPALPARSIFNPEAGDLQRGAIPAAPTPDELDASFHLALASANPAIARVANAVRFQTLSAQLAGHPVPQFDDEALRAHALEVQSRREEHSPAISFPMRLEAARRLDAWCAEDLLSRNEARFLIMEAILDGRVEFVADRRTGQPPDPDALRLKLEIENLIGEHDTWTDLHGKCASILAGVVELDDAGRGQPGLSLLKNLWSKLTEVATRCRDEAERDFVVSLRAAVWRQRADILEYYQGRRSFFPANFDCAHPHLPSRAWKEPGTAQSVIRGIDGDPGPSDIQGARPGVVTPESLRPFARTEAQAQAAEDAFLRCTDGPGSVDFTRLDADALGRMTPSAWQTLFARLPKETWNIRLPNFAQATATVMPAVVAGLSTLPLTSLTVTLPGVEQGQRLDLSGLPSSTQVIEFAGSQPEDSPLTVVVPNDVVALILPARSTDVRILESIGGLA